jgi:hypothetical protein
LDLDSEVLMKKPKIGDIFEIPLTKSRRSYGQYLYFSKMGPIIQIFDVVSSNEMNVDQIICSQPLFPPIIVGLFAAIKDKIWKVVGNKPIESFKHPLFVSNEYDQITGEARTWFIWNGQEYIKVGIKLPDRYKKLEFLVVWSSSSVVERIENRRMPFPYYELIQFNKFTPK